MTAHKHREILAKLLRGTASEYLASIATGLAVGAAEREVMSRELDRLLADWEAVEGSPQHHAKNERHGKRRPPKETPIH